MVQFFRLRKQSWKDCTSIEFVKGIKSLLKQYGWMSHVNNHPNSGRIRGNWSAVTKRCAATLTGKLISASYASRRRISHGAAPGVVHSMHLHCSCYPHGLQNRSHAYDQHLYKCHLLIRFWVSRHDSFANEFPGKIEEISYLKEIQPKQLENLRGNIAEVIRFLFQDYRLRSQL